MSPRALLPVLVLPGCILNNLLAEKSETETFTLEQAVEGVQFELPAGAVTIEVGDVERVEVTRTLHYQGDPPTTTEDVAAQTLFLKAECPETNRVCSIDIDLRVPSATWAAGETGAGDITISGPTGGVDLVTGAGDVSVEGAIGNVTIDTGAGTIDGAALEAAQVVATTGAGDVDLEVIGVVSSISIDSGAGDIDLLMPAGTYAATVATGAGKVNIEGITADATVPASLYVHTGKGNITITGF